MDKERVRELEDVAQEMMGNPMTKRGEVLTQLLRESENFKQVFFVFNSTGNQYLQYLCINSLISGVAFQWKGFSNEEKKFLFESNYLMIFECQNRPGYLVSAHCKFLARIYRLGMLELEQVKNLVSQLVSLGPNQSKLVCRFLLEIIQEIHETIKHRSLVLNKKTAIRFRDDSLCQIVNFCIKNILSPQNSIETLTDNLNLLSQSLNFDFSGTNSDDLGEEPMTLQIPLSWKPFLYNPELFTSIEKLFDVENEDLRFFSFKVLNQFCGIRRSLFIKSEEKENFANWIMTLLQGCMQKVIRIICNDQGLDSSCLELLLQGVKRFLVNFGVKDLSEKQEFFLFLDAFSSFSMQLFRVYTFVPNQNSIQVWSCLSYDGLSQSSKLKPYITRIFNDFIENSFQLLCPSVFQITNESCLEDLLDHLSLFSTHIFTEILDLLIPKFSQVFSSLSSPSPLSGHISWSIYLCSCLISNTSKKSGSDQDDKLVENMSEVIPKVLHLGGFVEKAVIYFCKAFTQVYLGSSMDNCWGDSETLLSQKTIGQISMIIIEIIFTCFSKYSEGDVLQKAIELFEKICCGYYSNKVISSMPATFSLINYPPCNFTNYKMRCSLFFALTELWAADLHNLEQFLNLLRGKIRTCVGKMKETKDLFSEMMGISKALNNEKLFLVMFDVVYHEIWDVVHGLKEFKVDFEMFKIVFRFFTEFSENRSSRIKFEASDPFGIVIFRNLAEMVSVFYGFPDENESNLNTKVKILLRLVNNLLRGGYICFGVFEIYNDPCYLNTIIITFQAILKTTEIQVKLIQRYPKIFLLIFEFFDLLCKNHQKVLLLNSPDYCLVTMLDLFIFTFKTEDLHFSKNNLIIVCGSLIHLFEFSFKVLQKNNLLSNQLMEVLQNVSQKLEKLFEGIFDLILNHDISLMWSVNKVLLLMAILFEENYHKLKTEAISRFSESFEVRHQIEEAFSKLFIGIEKTLDSKNKDQYTKNFGEFKQTMSIL